MTENWLIVVTIISAIVMAVATLLGPALAVYTQYRLSQPKPEEDQSKNQSQRVDGWFRWFLMSPWVNRILFLLSLLLIMVNIYLLLSELRETTPVTRRSVWIIASAVGQIFFSLLNMGLLSAFQSISQLRGFSKESFEFERQLIEIDRSMLDLVKTLHEGNSAVDREIFESMKRLADSLPAMIEAKDAPQSLQLTLNKPPQSMFDRLQATIKKLLGE